MIKRIACFCAAALMCLTLCVPVFGETRISKRVTVHVSSEDDIVAFLKTDYDRNQTYLFVYEEVSLKALCPSCGYNTYRGSTYEEFKDGNDNQGTLYPCPDDSTFFLSDDAVNKMIVYNRQYCITCGYERNTSYDKYYITCILETTRPTWVATQRRTSGDMHEWLDWWDDLILHRYS